MLSKIAILSLLLVGFTQSNPLHDELMFEGSDEDTATVESIVREARAAPKHIGDLIQPGVKDAFLYVYGDAENDDGDVHGYSKTMQDKGQDGYKHRDTFHKQDGDKYGYEKHSEYGQANRAKIEKENDDGQKEAEEAATELDGNGEETRKSYSVFEDLNEDNKKQPKKKVEAEFNYYGEDGGEGGDGGGSYYSGGSSKKNDEEGGDGESSEGGEGGDGEKNDEYEESEESEEGDGEAEDDY